MIYNYDIANKELSAIENNVEECLRTMHYLAIDYDEAKTIEDFKMLVDDLDRLAQNALEFLFTGKVFIEDTEDEDHDTYITALDLRDLYEGENKND